jgi:hypothetical protein
MDMQRVGAFHNSGKFNGIFPIFNGRFNAFSNGHPRLSYRRPTRWSPDNAIKGERNDNLNCY